MKTQRIVPQKRTLFVFKSVNALIHGLKAASTTVLTTGSPTQSRGCED
ncbi:hypothetical protein [Pedobacter borealis]|nr:hypothetical protein [Pedobacter borealis]